jgi:hypothetical protein
MGIDPDISADPVEVVISRAEKPYKKTLSLEELTPLGTPGRHAPLLSGANTFYEGTHDDRTK